MSVSNALLHDISHFAIHSYDHVTSYDHRSMHLEIKLKKYFRKNTQHIPENSTRYISSSQTKKIQFYKNQVYQSMTTKEIAEKINLVYTKLTSNTITSYDKRTNK